MDEGDIINTFREVWEEFGHPLSTLAMLVKLPWTSHQGAVSTLKSYEIFDVGQRLAMTLDEFRLIVKGVHLAGGSRAEYLNNSLCFSRKMRAFGSEWILGSMLSVIDEFASLRGSARRFPGRTLRT